jgi:hypothetical protein
MKPVITVLNISRAAKCKLPGMCITGGETEMLTRTSMTDITDLWRYTCIGYCYGVVSYKGSHALRPFSDLFYSPSEF